MYPVGYTNSMSITTMKIQTEVRDSLARVANEDFRGVTLSDAVARLLVEHDEALLRRQMAAAYERLRGDAPAWAAYVAEIDEWDGVTADNA